MEYGIARIVEIIMKENRKKDLFVFVLGLLALVKVRFVGTFAIAELVAFAMLPFINWSKFKENQQTKTLFKLAFLWLVGVVVSDMYNGSSSVDSLKGAFNVVFLIALIPFAYWMLNDNPKRLLYFWGGNAISSLYSFYYLQKFETEFDRGVWQTYAWYQLSLFIGGYLYFVGRKKLAYLAIGSYGVWALFHNSRSIILTSTVSVVLLLFIDYVRKDTFEKTLYFYLKKLKYAVVAILIGIAGVTFFYSDLAESGALGERAYEKYMMQKDNKIGLASGRADALISWELIKEHPIVGYGSYAKDKYGYAEKYLDTHKYNYVKNTDESDEYLPGHSYILGSWVYAGILSLPFWLYVLWQIIVLIRKGNILKSKRMLGMVSLLTMLYLWNILFSPFSDRLQFLVFILIIVFLNSEYNYFNSTRKYFYDKDFNHNTLLQSGTIS